MGCAASDTAANDGAGSGPPSSHPTKAADRQSTPPALPEFDHLAAPALQRKYFTAFRQATHHVDDDVVSGRNAAGHATASVPHPTATWLAPLTRADLAKPLGKHPSIQNLSTAALRNHAFAAFLQESEARAGGSNRGAAAAAGTTTGSGLADLEALFDACAAASAAEGDLPSASDIQRAQQQSGATPRGGAGATSGNDAATSDEGATTDHDDGDSDDDDDDAPHPRVYRAFGQAGVSHLQAALDLGGDDAALFFLLFRLGAQAPWCVTRQSWRAGWAALLAFDMKSAQQAVAKLTTKFHEFRLDDPQFATFLDHWLFAFLKQGKTVDVDTAVTVWEGVLSERWQGTGMWVAFVRSRATRRGGGVVFRDQWEQLRRFAALGGWPECIGYDPDSGAWASIIDDFVVFTREQDGAVDAAAAA